MLFALLSSISLLLSINCFNFLHHKFLYSFYLQVKAEDRGVERAAALAADERVRIAASDTIEALLETDFRLIINDTEYYVKTPAQVSISI